MTQARRDRRCRATEIHVRLDHEGLDPVCDGAKRTQIAVRQASRLAGVLQILEEEEIRGLRRHGTFSRREPKKWCPQRPNNVNG
jgi:hypothetical protein